MTSTTITTTIDNDNNIQDPTTFVIHDNSSKFARFIPEKWIEALTIVSKVKGYDGIDEYILELIRSRLEMFTDTRDTLDDAFQKYMQNIEGITDEEEKDNST